MNWKISDFKANATILNLGIEIVPPDPVISAFFIGMHLARFPQLLNAAANNTSFNNELSSFLPYEIMDEEDLSNAVVIEPGEIQISHQLEGKSIVNGFLFNLLLKDYSNKLVELYAANSEVQASYNDWRTMALSPGNFYRSQFLNYPESWTEAMNLFIQKLEEKIASDLQG